MSIDFPLPVKEVFFPTRNEVEVKRFTNSKNEHLILTEGDGHFRKEKVLSLYKAQNTGDSFEAAEKVSAKLYNYGNGKCIMWRNQNGENAMMTKGLVVSPNPMDGGQSSARRNYFQEVESKSLKACFSRRYKKSPLVVHYLNFVEATQELYPKAKRAISLLAKITR